MPNRFLRLMDERGERSVAALKRLYRAACKRVHPDALRAGADPHMGSASDGRAFMTIRAEYEEALAAMRDVPGAGKVIVGRPVPREEPAAARSPARRGSAPVNHADPDRDGPAAARTQAGAAAVPPTRSREPPSLAAFREACARIGTASRAWDDDPYRWKPSVESVTELLVLAHAVSGGRMGAELGALETVLSSLIARRAELARYPGIMTRMAMLYRAFSHWSAWRTGGDGLELAACRTRLVELEDPTATLVKSAAVADVTDSFPAAARFLRVAWGLPGDLIDPGPPGRDGTTPGR